MNSITINDLLINLSEYNPDAISDVKKAYGIDDTAVLKHFVVHGMSEGRQASAKFNVKKYKNNYKDLRKAYGNNFKSYYYLLYYFTTKWLTFFVVLDSAGILLFI